MEINRLAAEQLGSWRLTVRGELRGLPRFLRDGERVVGLALGTLDGWWKGRLCVATDSRMLLVHKWPLRPTRCEDIPYERIGSLNLTATASGPELSLNLPGRTLKLSILAGDGEELMRVMSEQTGGDRGSIEPGAAVACANSSFALPRLALNLAALVPLILYWADVLDQTPALVAFVGLALVDAALDWRAGRTAPQAVAGLTLWLAIALFVFDVLSPAPGLLLVLLAFAVVFGLRRATRDSP